MHGSQIGTRWTKFSRIAISNKAEPLGDVLLLQGALDIGSCLNDGSKI
jgi:hypothetical protein